QSAPDLLMEKILSVIDTADIDQIMVALQIGTERPEEFSYEQRNVAFVRIIERFRTPTQRAELWKMIRFCAARPEIIARQMACAILDNYWKDKKTEAERILLNLARDEDWEVREYASATIARIVRSNFKAVYPYLLRWAESDDPSVRRQVMVAIVAISDQEHPEWAKPLLDLVETNLKNRDPYVRRNLGPFALGEGLLRNYPEDTLEAMSTWTNLDDEMVRWNIGMGLTVSHVGDYWEAALIILKSFGTDKRRMVWQAVSMALQNLLHLHPDVVEPRLNGWMKEEPGLRVAVSTALAAYRSMN
ncbi:MAG: HEAT repeat domain-containing protein, partial [Candidatus Eisenbacteria bacterium]|nr:HEAT repeat domain-containing protein [Candidatus Eisenbacteria bacterium]